MSETLHDAKCPRGLEHRTSAIYVQAVRVSRNGEEAQVGAVGAIALPVRAVGVGDTSKLVDGSNESANEE